MVLDLIIRGGTVIDGTGSPGFRGDLALSQGAIARVGDLTGASAAAEIDARGLAVAPGFIDLHSHTDLYLPLQPTADSLVQQGITTAVTGQCGLSPAPLGSGDCRQIASLFGARLNRIGDAMPWAECASLAGYLQHLDRLGLSLNVAQLVGQGVIRAAVMGFDSAAPDAAQRAAMRRLAEEAMEQGAFGISTGLIYPPGFWSTTDELLDLVQAVAARGGRYFSHMRDEGHDLFHSIDEALEIGRRTGAHTQISHFKAAGKANWDKSAEALERLSRAAEKQPLGTDMYPYTAGSTALVALLPRWAQQGGQAAILARLSDAAERRRMTADLATDGLAAGNWEGVLIIHSAAKPEYVGSRLSDLAARNRQSPEECLIDLLLASRCDPMMALFMISEDNRRREITHPLMAVGTDGFGLATAGPTAGIGVHPRSFGTFPRVLGRYCREEGILGLEEAIHKMTGLAARYIGFKDRGLIREGLAADLVVFDSETVADTATYEHPGSYPCGIHQVLVAGRVVVDHGVHTGARPGRVLRRV